MAFSTPGTDALPTGKYGEVYILKEKIRKTVQAISIRFCATSYGLGAGSEALTNDVNTGSAVHWANVRHIRVYGRSQAGLLVQLTDDKTQTGAYLYDATNYSKLVDSNFGFPSVKILDDIGEVPDNVAYNVGRHELMSLLERGALREYIFDTEITTMPMPFETVDMADGFSGVVLDLSLSMNGGQETTTILVMDLS